MTPNLKRVDEYTLSGRWKCEKSPSGSHYWIITGATQKCKFCKEIREVPVSRSLGHRGYSIKARNKDANSDS